MGAWLSAGGVINSCDLQGPWSSVEWLSGGLASIGRVIKRCGYQEVWLLGGVPIKECSYLRVGLLESRVIRRFGYQKMWLSWGVIMGCGYEGV